ncbi:GGDEF domain-containing protein [Oscillochloris sp. ZM17-4]|uniref:GGDEF domain-containing protein n=1 Tax=Oscillochloris sp. ZM17-4 TaxID=2866714 RepID=UPI001C73DE19|nr:GGDEF domain-containing protein [Oscillochloris sp. ZM17-4]MBX0328114.1 GGDEF domain-containing protein [Oscillochloris sp. ZM17-4]
MKPSSPKAPSHRTSATFYPFKLRILKLLLTCGVSALLAIWALESLSGLIIQLDRVAYPIMAAVYASSLIAISLRPQTLFIAEKISFVTLALYVIIQLLSIVLDLQTDSSLYSIATMVQWVPLVYMTAFIFFETRHAIGISIIIYLTLLVPIIALLLLGGLASAQSDSHAIVINLLWAHPVYIVALTSIAWLKAHLVAARDDASVMSTAANVDYLTGVANRRAAAHALQAALAEAQMMGKDLAALLIDIDHFKQINDRFGHDVGDSVLIDLAAALRRQLRDSDTLGRWGGEEFIVIARQVAPAEAAALADRLRLSIAQRPAPQPAPITLSLGVSSARPDDTPESLVKRADEALYRAKQGGRNRVEVWSAE